MMADIIPFWKQKTTWTAAAGLVTAVGAFIAGDLSTAAMIASAFAAIGSIFMRQGIEKAKLNPTTNPALRGETPE